MVNKKIILIAAFITAGSFCISLFLGIAQGQEDEIAFLDKDTILHPNKPPIFGSINEITNDFDITVYYYEFDLTGDGKLDIIISSSSLYNGAYAGNIWKVYKQITDDKYIQLDGHIAFNKRLFFIRNEDDSRVSIYVAHPLDNGGFHTGKIYIQNNKIVDEIDSDTLKHLEPFEFYVFLDTDYRPKLMTLPYTKENNKVEF